MLIDLVDRLRCPNAHEQSWLVAAMDEMRDRNIVRGTLGCPVCYAEFPIVDGTVRFADVSLPPLAIADPDVAMRAAAALELTDARLVAVLHGRWASYAPLMRAISPARLILVNAPQDVLQDGALSTVHAATCPVASAQVDALALDDRDGPDMRESLAAAVRSGGRILAPASVPVPEGVRELTRDNDVWVGERKDAPPRLIGIGRR